MLYSQPPSRRLLYLTSARAGSYHIQVQNESSMSVAAMDFLKGVCFILVGLCCLSCAVEEVVEDPLHFFSKGDVSVRTSGESVGEALALCETGSDTTEI